MFWVLPTVAMLVKLPKVSVSAPPPRLMLALLAPVLSVIVSAPVPPISVLTLLTVPVLAALPSVSLLVPAPRSTCMLLDSACQRDGVVAGSRRRSVSRFATVAVLLKLLKVSESAAGAQADAGVVRRGAQGNDVGTGAADQRGDIADGAGVGGCRPASAYFAAAEIHLHGGVQRGGHGDVVVACAAEDGLGIGDGDGVGEIAKVQRVDARARDRR